MPAPAELNERHRMIGRMEAAGCTDKQIAAVTGYTINHISLVRTSPLYRALVQELSRELDSKMTFDLATAISAAAQEVHETKLRIMRQDDNLSAANAAADSYLDRLAPKQQTDASATVRLRFTLEDRASIDAILAESRDITPTPPAGVKPLAVAEAEARAAEREDTAA